MPTMPVSFLVNLLIVLLVSYLRNSYHLKICSCLRALFIILALILEPVVYFEFISVCDRKYKNIIIFYMSSFECLLLPHLNAMDLGPDRDS